ncbi:hypothetical protein [Bacteroides salyersiae]|jgi:hypothetical protein|uniref:hypothetical protein n=2 Tax=Bacteroides salyersiae TaxID=291644 RepID=UPI000470F50A|nr:hypothetical protein [Bacteroides salyersiae]MCS3060806.1 hypothetical protein [Bacteroides salyersiae]
MMKTYMNNKKYDNLHLHQSFNKRILAMKRESGISHHFSFGERFDETLMKGYYNGSQVIILSNHHFIGFSPFIKSAGKATEVNIAIHRQVGRTSGLPTDKGKPMLLAKRKRRPMSADIIADTAAGFWEAKSHNLLGHFLHAVQAPLKMPQ